MSRAIATLIAEKLFRYATKERYPTRSVEYLLAVAIFIWSARVAWPGDILAGPTYRYLTAIAPEPFWGGCGMVIALLRLYALVRNGAWKRSPELRLFGAGMGLIWWLILTVLYAAAVFSGAPDFPMRWVLCAFMYFEIYSCFRCGQDRTAMRLKAQTATAATAQASADHDQR